MSTKNKTSSDFKSIKWLFATCKKQIPLLLVVVMLNCIYGVTSVFFANFSKRIIDGATEARDINVVVKFAIAMLGLVVFQLLLNITKNSLMERCAARIEVVLKKKLLISIMKKDYSSVTAYHSGELQNRLFNDVKVISDGFAQILPQGTFFASKLLSSLIYLIIIDKIFALVFVVGGLMVFLITRFFRRTLKRLHKLVQETEGNTRSFMQEAILNLLVVKAFSVEGKIDKQADELQEVNFKTRMKRRNFSIVANTGLGAMFSMGTVFGTAFGAWSILNNAMSYGTVTVIIYLVNQIQSPFASLSGIMPRYYSVIASAERIMEIEALPDEEEINDKNLDVSGVYDSLERISFENITFKYDRDEILTDTSLDINKGDFVAIMGISGIGKSTLLKLLLGVFRVQSGTINLKLKENELTVDRNTRRLFTYVPQGNMLVSGTIRENLTFINENVTEEEIQRAIEVSCAKQFIDEFPLGLETVIGEKGMGLSEGQTQRLAIARSILSKAPIILLDEATSALDEATEKQFLTNLKELKDITCIIVSHKKAALEICDKKIQIVDNKIICEG